MRGMGVLRSPHEATCPSIASRFFHEGASMSSPTQISPDKLARLIGTANLPAVIDVRTEKFLPYDRYATGDSPLEDISSGG